MNWILLIAVVAASSIISLTGGIYMLSEKRGALKLQQIAIPLAAGALLAAAFLDLIPEAIEVASVETIMLAVLAGFIAFFIVDRFLGGHHHDHEHERKTAHGNASLVVIGDCLHNFLDGVALGIAFLASPALGIVTAIAVTAHEIPREIGDFGLLLKKGLTKKNTLLANLAGALASVVGAVIAFGFGDFLPGLQPTLLAVTAGFFLYVAASDIVPSLHSEKAKWASVIYLVVGAAFVGITVHVAHSALG